MKRWALVVAVILVLSMVPVWALKPVGAQMEYTTKTVTVNATADTWIAESGYVDYKTYRLAVGTYYGKEERTYVKFDLRKYIPPSAVVIKATLVLHAYNHYGTLSHNVSVYGVYDDNWSEKSLRWYNQPTNVTGPLSWTVVSLPKGNVDHDYSWNVTDFVAGQVSGDGIVSFYLHSNLSHVHTKDYIYFASKENKYNPGPRLVVEYYVPISITGLNTSRPAIEGHPVTITVAVKNSGKGTQNAPLCIYVDDQLVFNNSVTLYPGKSETFNYKWLPTSTGVHRIQVMIGSYDLRYRDVWVAPDPNVVAYGLTPYYERFYNEEMANLTPLYDNFTATVNALKQYGVDFGDLAPSIQRIENLMNEMERQYGIYNALKRSLLVQNPNQMSYYYAVMIHIRKAAFMSREALKEIEYVMPYLSSTLEQIEATTQPPASQNQTNTTGNQTNSGGAGNGTSVTPSNQSNVTPSTNITIHITRVLVDAGHGQYYVNDVGVANLTTRIKDELGWEVDVTKLPLTSDVLKDYDVVILLNPKEDLTSGEITALREFVENGGGLFIAGDWYKYVNLESLNALVNGYGIKFNDDELEDDDQNSGRSYYPFVGIYNADHPAMKFVPDGWKMYYSGDTLDVSGNAVWLIRAYDTAYSIDASKNVVNAKGSEPVIAAAVEVGSGRVIAYGSSRALSDSYYGKYLASNWPFIKGALMWLVHED